VSFFAAQAARASAGGEAAAQLFGAPPIFRSVRRFGDDVHTNTQPPGVNAFGGNSTFNIFDEVRARSAPGARARNATPPRPHK
jgi:hypothetical protein